MKNEKHQIMKHLLTGVLLIAALTTTTLSTFATPENNGEKTRTITVDNATIAYRILGGKSGIPLILLSPLGWSMDDWDPAIIDGLAKRTTVVLFDYKGVGSSSGKTRTTISEMANDAISFIKALGYPQVNLLGFSMGGFVAQQIVETDPQLVNKLVLTGTGPQGSEGLAAIGQKVQEAGNLNPEEQYLHFLFAPNEVSRQLGQASFARIHAKKEDRDPAITQESFVAELTAVLGWAQPDPGAFAKARTLTNPVLIIGGQSDFFIPANSMLTLSQAIPNSRLLLLQGAGHATLNQYPVLFLQETVAFLKN